MVEVVFTDAAGESSIACPGKPGDALADLCDDHEAPIPFACRGASCGACLVVVDDPHYLLSDPEVDERDFLAGRNLSAPHRLTCQARLKTRLPEVQAHSTSVQLHVRVS